ncbi:MAG: S9 family peptidase [Bacteroidaceae bacterium]|nr:S9 family peptidase [Bacteroidaceae bacterium]
MKKLIFTLVALTSITQIVNAQGTAQDYKNAFAIRGKYSNKMTNGSVNVRFPRNASGNSFTYSTFNGDSTVWYEVDIATGDKKQISNPETRRRPEYRGGGSGVHWMVVRDEKDGRAENPVNKNTFIIHKANNLHLVSGRDDANSVQLTADGVDTCYYSSWGTWSPDGKYYATVLIKPAPKRFVTYTLSSPSNQVQPIYSQQEYAKPGDSLNYRIPVVVDVENKRTIYPKSTDLFKSQYDVTSPRWDKNNKTLTFEFNERGHKTFRILEMDLEGNVKTLIEEKNDKYVAYSRNLRRNLSENHILWKSDRDGHAHLYLYDRKKDKLTQITKGEYWVRNVQHAEIDEKGKGYIIFSANGMNCKNMGVAASSFDGKIAEEDPYNIHYYRIDMNGKNLVELTPERANHSATINIEKNVLVDTYSTVDQAPVTVLRSLKDGKLISTLETANISKLESTGWKAPEVFVAPGRDGKTDMWGIIQRPSNFDPNKKYPVIEYIYSGPGDQYVPKTFTPWLYNLADLAELGFIVVQLDGMTTSFRNLDFEQVCYKNLKDAGFPDRIAWMKAAAEKYPYMDLDRVGIYGCSAGGQEALGALLFHGDFYKAAYAACGCHDNRMDKIWWNEQWMGYPIDQSYIDCSNVENAKNLKGKLMLVVGEMDDNVDPSSSYQVVNALIKANKDFEFILLPGARHTMGESYGEHKRYDFFVKNLLGVEPPAWNEVK